MCDLVIPTLDYRIVKGVRSVSRVAYRVGEREGYDTKLLFNAIPWEDCLTSLDLLRGRWSLPTSEVDSGEIRGTMIGRVLPELLVTNYLLNYPQWKQEIDGSLVFGVGGSCLPCLPAAIADIDYNCWLGTTLDEEFDTQFDDMSTAWRIRDRLTRPVLRRYEEYVLDRANHIYYQSTYTKRSVLDRFDVSERKLSYLPVPIDTDRYAPTSDAGGGSPEVLFVGRVNDPRKNVPYLLDAFARVREEVPDATLTLVGQSPDRPISERIEALGLSDAVLTPGSVPEVAPYYERADVFVIPSRQEGLGIAGLEAMSAGLPVVSTACGGPEDYVDPGESGYLVPHDEPDGFAGPIVEILEDPDTASRMSARAREIVEERFSERAVNDRIASAIGRGVD